MGSADQEGRQRSIDMEGAYHGQGQRAPSSVDVRRAKQHRQARKECAASAKLVGIVTSTMDDLEKRLQGTAAQHNLAYRLMYNQAHRFSFDEMMPMTQRFLNARTTLLATGKPSGMDFGYHYTQEENLASIRKHGLMTETERVERKIDVRKNGSSYGSGIYSASNPFAYHGRYGNICIVLARIPGVNRKYSKIKKDSNGADSVTVHSGEFNECLILSRSDFCLPLFYFNANIIDSNGWIGNATIDMYHMVLLTALGQYGYVPNGNPLHLRWLGDVAKASTIYHVAEEINYEPPDYVGLPHMSCFWVDYYSVVPIHLANKCCSVCQRPFTLEQGHHEDKSVYPPIDDKRLKVVQLLTSHNEIHHLSCSSVGLIWGKMPAATMNVRKSRKCCDGYPIIGSLVIEYSVDSDEQRFYHPNPGVDHRSTHRKAYLPDSTEGRNLLKRLKYAFRAGLTFTVGVSLQSGKHNAVTWASIPHKTCRSGGIPNYGFPDLGYFFYCNLQLDILHVPAARDLP